MLLGEGVKGDASKLNIYLTSDAICIITHAQDPCICRKRGFIIIYFFCRGSPRWGLTHQGNSELAGRVGTQGPGYRGSFVCHLPVPDSPGRYGRWGPWISIGRFFLLGISFLRLGGTLFILWVWAAFLSLPGSAHAPLDAGRPRVQQGTHRHLM